MILIAALSSLSIVAQQPTELKRPAEWLADWLQVDWEREKIEKGIVTDTASLHHTAGKPGITWQELSELQRKRLYDKRYAITDLDPLVKGLPPHSGHRRYDDNGKLVEVYYAYHYIIRQNGKVESLLDEKEVGWANGNWNENMRAISIVLDGDFSAKPPPKKMLKAVAKLLRDIRKRLPIARLKAHYDFVKSDQCPGEWYRQKDKHGRTGRAQILRYAKLQLVQD